MREFTIVITDDDEDDFTLLKEAFDKCAAAPTLIHLQDGEKLLDYLYDRARFGETLPDLIILDINMPRLDGIRALELIRATKIFYKIPIVMHSTCGTVETRTRCRILGANGFAMKATYYPKIATFAQAVLVFLEKLLNEPGCRFEDNLVIEENLTTRKDWLKRL